MSKITLENPLDKFASYSIHHILLACRTTEEAKVFMNESDNGPTLTAIEQTKNLGDAVPLGKGNTAFLVIDTRRFSQYSVDKLEYEVFVNGLEKAGAHGNVATTVNMTVSDTVGISFINFIQWLMNEKMQTNFDGMIFMHRVIFIGHNSNGKTEVVQSVTIPMHLFKMELSLDALKGTYDLQFMPNMNFDVTQHRRWLNIHNASKYFSGTTNTLGSVIDSFEAQLNKVSQEYYNKVQTAMQDRLKNGGKYGRLVQYQITIPGEWRSYKMIGASTADSTETIFTSAKIAAALEAEDKKKQEDATRKVETTKGTTGNVEKQNVPEKTAGTPRETNISVETDRQITEVIDFIFKQVPQISDLGAGKKVTGDRGSVTFYKHFVGITSDDSTILVHVDVVPFEVPNVLVDAPATVANGDDQFYQKVGPDGARRPLNYMEFDYIFTGKNKDVLDFDLKLQDLQWMLASQLNLGPGVDGVVENTRTGLTPIKDKVDERSELITSRPYDAILVPKKTAQELENYKNYTTLLSKDEKLAAVKSANNYMQNLSMYYAMAPITAIMTIRGNPDIMTKFNQNSFLDHQPPAEATASPQQAALNNSNTVVDDGPHAAYRAAFKKKILENNFHKSVTGEQVTEFRTVNGVFQVAKTLGSANYATAPVFVTVNVMGPTSKMPGMDVANKDFAEKLLLDNYYVVFRVKNKIEGNIFTQELELYSHNIFGMGKVNPMPGTKAQ